MKARGFTLVELLVVVSIVALSVGLGLERLLKYQELGERAAVEQNLAVINTALTLRFAAYVISGNPSAVEADVGSNPVRFLERPPDGYLGELDGVDPKTLPRASWYFDRATGELTYLPARRRYLSSGAPPEILHFRVALTAGRDEPGAPREVPQHCLNDHQPIVWEID
jgi:general secretion pathway protein G